MKRRIVAFLAAALAALSLSPLAAYGQTNPTIGPVNFSFTAVNQQTTIPMSGQQVCTVNVYSVGGGTTLAATASSDNVVYTSATTIGTAGSITAIGSYTGNVSAFGVTQFRVQATALTSGTVSGVVTCGVQNGSATGGTGGAQAVNITQVGGSPATAPLQTTPGGSSTVPIAAATAANTVLKGAPGRLVQCMVTTVGTAEMDLFDNATTNTGTKIGVIPASAAVGSIFTWNFPAALGITAGGAAAAPGVTCSIY